MFKSIGVLCVLTGVAMASPSPAPSVEHVRLWEGFKEVEVTVSNARSLEPEAFSAQFLISPSWMFDSGRERTQRVTAREVSTVPTVIAFVVEAGDPTLADTIEALDLARFHPESWAIVVTHDRDGARITANGHPSTLRRAQLLTAAGSTNCPSGDCNSTHLADGLQLGVESLLGVFDEHRVLIVVGQGGAPAASRHQMSILRRQISAERIDAYAFVRPPQADPNDPVVFVGEAIPKTSYRAELPGALRAAIDQVEGRRLVTFPEVDAHGARVPWDGVRRELVITVNGVESWASESVVLPAPASAASHCCDTRGSWHWAALAAAIAILIAWLWTRRAVRAI